jgi:hypothetical protein
LPIGTGGIVPACRRFAARETCTLARLLQNPRMRRTSVSSPASATKTWTGAALERRGFGVDRLAWWLDNAITVPGTRWRIGYDALIGLIPGVGDFVGTLLSSYIIVVAAAQGLPPSALARMVINVGLEALVGAVPIVGDLFDAAWKANQRNIGLMAQFQGTPEVARRQSRAVVAAWAAAAITLIVILGIGAFAIVRWLVDVLRSAG